MENAKNPDDDSPSGFIYNTDTTVIDEDSVSAEPLESPVHTAVRSDDVRTLAELYKLGQDINTKDDKGRTPLILAIQLQHQAVAIALLHFKANLDMVDFDGETALLCSLRTHQTDLAKQILGRPQNVNVENNEGKTATHYAVEDGQHDLVVKLISLGADVNHVDWNGMTPLMMACLNNDFNIAALLLQHDADFNKRDSRLYSARDYASVCGCIDIVRMMNLLSERGGSHLQELTNNKAEILPEVSSSLTNIASFRAKEEDGRISQVSVESFPKDELSPHKISQPHSSLGNDGSSSSSDDMISLVSSNVQRAECLVNQEYCHVPFTSFDSHSPETGVFGNKTNIMSSHTQEECTHSDFQGASSDLPDEEDEVNPTICYFPENCRYERKMLDWKKVYKQEKWPEKGLKLAEEQKLETEFEYTKGDLKHSSSDSCISATDLLSSGLQMLLNTQEERPYLPLPDITNLMNLAQLDQSQIANLQKWFSQEQRLSELREREIEDLIYYMKMLLVENKDLKMSVSVLQKDLSEIQCQLDNLSKYKKLSEIKKEIHFTKKLVMDLNREHKDVIESKTKIENSIGNQFENSFTHESRIMDKIEDLKRENKKLSHLLEVIEIQAQESSDCLLKRFDESLKTIKILFGLLEIARHFLEERFEKANEITVNLQNINNAVNELMESIRGASDYCKELLKHLDWLEQFAIETNDDLQKLQTEIQELLKKFESFRNSLASNQELEDDKKRIWVETKDIFYSFKIEKKNIKHLKKNIRKLCDLIDADEDREKKEEKMSTLNREEQEDNKMNWNNKMTKLLGFFECMDEISTEIKHETKLTTKQTLDRMRIEGDPIFKDEETTKFTARFICSNTMMGELQTKSGVYSITEATKPVVCYNDGISDERLEHRQTYDSSYSVGQQNIKSVPESTTSQLRGTFAKYKLRDAKTENLSL